MKNRIIIVNSNAKIGGIQKALNNLLHDINEQYEITLLLFDKDGSLLSDIPDNVEVLQTKSHFRYIGMAQADCKSIKDKLIRAFYVFIARYLGQETAVKLAKLTLRADKDLFDREYDSAISYSHMSGNHSFYGGTAQYVLDACNAKEKVCYIHCDYKNSGCVSEYSNRIYRQFDKIVCVSESTKKRFLEVLPELSDRTIATYNPINEAEIRALAEKDTVQYDKNFLNLLTIARLTAEKGVERFVRVLGSVDFSKVRYYVVGSGQAQPRIEEEIRKHGLEDHVFLVGEDSNPYRHMKNADMLVLPSYHEAAPVVFQEAKALGVPVFTTRTTSADEMIGEKYGVVVNNSDEAIAIGLKQILENFASSK